MEQGDRVTYSPSIDHGYSHLPMVALDRVRSGFCRRSGNHGAIRERGRFGSIRMVRCLGSGIQTFHLERVVQ